MKLKTGLKLNSAVSEVQVIVVRAPSDDVVLGCGGVAMVEDGSEVGDGGELDASLGDAPLVGKRYADDELGLELLCVRAGDGALTINGRALPAKGAKPLKSAD